ncbi:hypothetical protein F4779DRAFT_611208 [Xylariaceae sp. FL0662B]|nr:hypothetical protein F4779DRAFT_611208 [Xylariaceae sp. FL0662B]
MYTLITCVSISTGSWVFFSSEPCVRYMSDSINMGQLEKMVPGLITRFKQFLNREMKAVEKTYLGL